MIISKKETLELKGIAIILLFIHHFLWNYSNDNALTFYIVRFTKICVGIFVFLSGYGLAKSQMNKEITGVKFVILKIKQLMTTYQKVFCLFVAIALVFNLRSFKEAYTSKYLIKFILEFFGIHEF